MALNSKVPRIVLREGQNGIWFDASHAGAYEVATSVGRASLQTIQFQQGSKSCGHNGVEVSDVIEILIHKLSQENNRGAVVALLGALKHVKDETQ